MSQVRVSETTHALLRVLSTAEEVPMQDILEKAVENYQRKVFLEGLSEDYRLLRNDEAASKEHEEESLVWDGSLMDGLEDE